VTAHGTGGEVIEPLGASTMPQSVLPTPSQFGSSVTAVLTPDRADADMDLDLDLGDPETGSPTSPGALEPSVAFAPSEPAPPHDDLSLDFSLPDGIDSPATPTPTTSGRTVPPQAFDLGDISFDLDMPETLPPSSAGVAAPMSGFGDVDLPPLDVDADPLSRKLDLAEEFRQIGDTDGARDLLQEVVAKATGAVKSRAESMLAALG
jgi:pilus assembly protein FimV